MTQVMTQPQSADPREKNWGWAGCFSGETEEDFYGQ